MVRRAPEVLGIVGMRSGSVGVLDKNIRPLQGRPLAAWIIDTALRADSVSRVVVSTDSDAYARVARDAGAETPCLRPAELARPDATDVEFILHMLDWLEEHEHYRPDIVLRLLATCPLQQPGDLDAVVDVLHEDEHATSAMVIAEARQHPAKVMRIASTGPAAGYLVPFVDDGGSTEPQARQRYALAYVRANVVASRLETIRDTGTLTGDRVAYHVVPQTRSIDIDSETDFLIADALLARELADGSERVTKKRRGR